jgi:Transposase IS116/IS110/IS902 family
MFAAEFAAFLGLTPKQNSSGGTLGADRVFLAQISCRGAKAVRVTPSRALCRSLTWDQAAEIAQHARLNIEAGGVATGHQREH